MATEQQRDDSGKFVPEGAVTQEDGKALDVVTNNEESDPRLAMMRKARDKRAEEMGAEVVEEKEGEEAEGKEKEKEAPVEGEGEKAEGEEAAPAELADDAIVEIQVNGKPEKMKWSEAKKKLQLATATEETLAQAKETREAANRELEAAAAVRKVMGEKTDQPTGEPKLKPEEEAAKRLAEAETAKRTARRKHADAIRNGTEEEVEAAETALDEAESTLDKIKFEQFTKPAAPQRDQLLERETVDTNRASESYLEKFAEDQKDELFRAAVGLYLRKENIADLTKMGADEKLLAKLTDVELGEHHFRARARGLVRKLDDVLNAAGTKAREELSRRKAPTPGASPREERQAAKQNAPAQPRPASGRVPEPEEAKPPTNQDLVAEARRRRGKA